MDEKGANEMIDWNGLRIQREIFGKIGCLISYLLTVIDHSKQIAEDEKLTIIEFTYELGRVLWDVSDEAFVHAFHASLAVQRFLTSPNEANYLSIKTHLNAIQAMLFLDERTGPCLPNQERVTT